VEKAGSDRADEDASTVGEQNEDNRGGQRKAGPGGEPAKVTGAPQSNRKSDLARGRSWQELAQSHKVDIGLFIDPSLPDNEFLAEISDVSDRSAKAAYAELEERQQHFQRRACGLEDHWLIAVHANRTVCRPLRGLSRHA
jgi:hypothetical protein